MSFKLILIAIVINLTLVPGWCISKANNKEFRLTGMPNCCNGNLTSSCRIMPHQDECLTCCTRINEDYQQKVSANFRDGLQQSCMRNLRTCRLESVTCGSICTILSANNSIHLKPAHCHDIATYESAEDLYHNSLPKLKKLQFHAQCLAYRADTGDKYLTKAAKLRAENPTITTTCTKGFNYDTEYYIECHPRQCDVHTSKLRLPQLATAGPTIYICRPQLIANVSSCVCLSHDYKDQHNLESLLWKADTFEGRLLANPLLARNFGLETQLQAFRPRLLLEVEQFAIITHTLLQALKPLNQQSAMLMSNYYNKLTLDLVQLVISVEVMQLRRSSFDLLSEVIFGALPELVRTPTSDLDSLPTALLQLNECIHMLGVIGGASKQIKPNDPSYVLRHDNLSVEMLSIAGYAEHIIQRDDVLFKFGPAQFQSLQAALQSNVVTLQVISLPQPLYRNTQTNIFYLNAFSYGHLVNAANDMLQLHSTYFDIFMNLTGIASAGPQVINAALAHGGVGNLYRFSLPPNALLEVQFLAQTTDLRVLLKLQQRPSMLQLHHSNTIIYGSTKNNSIFLFNPQGGNASYAYLAIMANGDILYGAKYQFVANIRECLSWSLAVTTPAWSSAGCQPLITSALGNTLHCQCNHLSMFAGKFYAAEYDWLQPLVDNWSAIVIFAAFFICFMIVLLLAYLAGFRRPELLIIDSRHQKDDQNVLVHITTGSYWCARTTSNITFEFSSARGEYRVTVYQHPTEFNLDTNSTCTLRMRSDYVTFPLRIKIINSCNGPYPAWYCESIEVHDMQRNQYHFFHVHRWIQSEPLFLNSRKKPKLKIRQLWRMEFVRHLINWFKFQPILGPWQYGSNSMNRFQRTCVWISKSAFMVCLIACSFGVTIVDDFQVDFDLLNDFRREAKDLFFLTLLAYAGCISIDLLYGGVWLLLGRTYS